MQAAGIDGLVRGTDWHEKRDGLLESPEVGAIGLLTQSDSEIEVKPDIPVDVGYGEDSDN